MEKLSKADRLLVKAKNAGYRVEPDGSPVGLRGHRLKVQTCGKNGYLFIKVSCKPYGSYPISAARLQALQKFGGQLFSRGMEVRHINGDRLDNSWNNISLGTRSENMLDRSSEDRVTHAKHAARSLRKITDGQAVEIRRRVANGEKQIDIAKEFGLAKSTVSQIVNNKTYKRNWRRGESNP